MAPPKRYELKDSPLQQLQNQMGRAKLDSSDFVRRPRMSDSLATVSNSVGDQESLYSFDSVSTNGRLLDRLGLDDEVQSNYPDDDMTRRNSLVSIKTTERLLDRLGLDEPDELEPGNSVTFIQTKNSKFSPITTSAGVNRYLSSRSNALAGSSSAPGSTNAKMNIKNIPKNIVLQNPNASIDSLKADVLRIENSKPVETQPNVAFQPSTPKSSTQKSSYSPFTDSGSPCAPGQHLENYSGNSNEDFTQSPSISRSSATSSPRVPMPLMRTPSLPISIDSSGSGTSSPSSRRVLSDNTSTATLGSSGSLTPESRTKLAVQLRGMGKHREASYQIHIAASPPHNYYKAMFLYSMALRYGQGVKQSDRNSLAWLCKCIITSSCSKTDTVIEKLNTSQPEELLSRILRNLDNDDPVDPIQLYDYYSSLPKAQLAKVISMAKSQLNAVPMAYHELANALLNGWGLPSKNEIDGIKLLSKSASMGNVSSMNQLGEIWSMKTKHHKKDLYQASAWLRLSEILGTKSVGNSWIYKEKYLPGEKKSKAKDIDA
ncbi:uncharacterized protein PRCAT00000678001 [Priceomyces carsonii]|uniref:uncharacterized protein n=1 Tax=Priceomyces carsonii TaxID=28549 RepID=UPI002EDAC14B|nr:unnamed protein product [Priceomyces carsonii]